MSIQSEIDRIAQNLANTYSVLEGAGAEMPQTRNSNNLSDTAASIKAVLYAEQNLTEAQKAQARENIGAAGIGEGGGSADGMEKLNAVASISVEYGRYEGASYYLARIPRYTIDGRRIKPKVALTSADGSLDGAKVSALTFAKRENTIFAVNAGLFDMNTVTPQGQTIIDGVSVTNTPMTDDMGTAISDDECYPLCINTDGDLSAPYERSVDTADMLSDRVIYAVTAWGQFIENFAKSDSSKYNEIVHVGKYIRQSIGQFQNGDYFVCTADATRGSIENEAGMTYDTLAELLISKGVKFAYSLDGGGSAETVIGNRQINPIFEGTAGRAVPTVIYFTTDEYPEVEFPTNKNISLEVKFGGLTNDNNTLGYWYTTNFVRCVINPIAVHMEQGYEYTISISNNADYRHGIFIYEGTDIADDFTVGNANVTAFGGTYVKLVDVGWSYADYTYTPTDNNKVFTITLRRNDNGTITEEDIATLQSLLVVTKKAI